MATKRTVIKPNEELVILGNLIIQGNVTQISNTSIVTNLAGNVLIVNSDGNATTATVALNSDGSFGNISYSHTAPDRLTFNRALQANLSLLSDQSLSIASGLTLSGNVLQGNVTGTASYASALETGRNFSITGDVTAPAISFDGTGPVALAATLINSGVTAGSYGNASTVGSFTVDAKGRLTSASDNSIAITSSQVTDFVTASNTAIDDRVTKSYVDALNVDADTLDNVNSTQFIRSDTNDTFNNGVVITFAGGSSKVHFGDQISAGSAARIQANGFMRVGAIFMHDTGGSNNPIESTGMRLMNNGGNLQFDGNAVWTANTVTAGSGIAITGDTIAVDSTVIRTNSAEQTIEGNLNINGNVDIAGNLNTQNVTDLYVEDIKIVLNANNSTTDETVHIYANRPIGGNVDIRWDEPSDEWRFTNDGSNYYPIPRTTTDLQEGTNLYYTVSRANTAIVDRINNGDLAVLVDSTAQSIAGVKTFTTALVLPGTGSAANGAIYHDGTDVFANVDGSVRILTGVNLGSVEDVGSTGWNIYAGSRFSSNVEIHGIRSINSGTYTTSSVGANVIQIEGNITAIREAFAANDTGGFGSFSYTSGTGTFNYTGVSTSEIRSQISGTGLINYNSGTGVITTTADNFQDIRVTTDTAGNIVLGSQSLLTFTAGTGIDITHSGSTITISTDADADISSVTAGDGLTGGGASGDVTLDVVGGDGITANANDIEVDSTVARRNADNTFTGNISQNDSLTNTANTTTSSTSEITLYSFPVASYRSGEFLVQARTSGNVHLTKMLVLYDGTNALATEYGSLTSNAELFTANVDVSGGDVRLRITPASSTSTTFKTTFTLLET